MTILVCGGNGYIGSHTVVELIAAGYEVVIADNMANSFPGATRAVRTITQRDVPLHHADIRRREELDAVFRAYEIDAVIHFAALKSVAESALDPLGYYETNVVGLLNLIHSMRDAHVSNLVFSSSAAVYGDCLDPPIDEDRSLEPTSPYGRTKAVAEAMLRDLAEADPTWRISMLRYFNAVGAHPSGELGESPRGTPRNLVPALGRVALGLDPELVVNGSDYDTPDGTCIRDYIHVVDLARGHLHALRALDEARARTFNLGCGRGYSVFETLQAFEKAAGRSIPYTIRGRRPGDIPESLSNPDRAAQELAWSAQYDIDAMCADTWRFMHSHPTGYDEGD